MKHLFLITLCIALLCAVPFVLPHRQAAAESDTPPAQIASEAPAQIDAVSPAVQEAAGISFDSSVTLRILHGDHVQTMTLREYLVGVLLAEIPAEFPEEALKAQAVAARTFALRKAEQSKHPSADICIDSSCCQGWLESDGAESVERLKTAVDATDGLVLTYHDALIDATFFSCSDGKTESAAAVWGSDIPYLQSVDSPGEETADAYTQTVSVEADYFAQVLENAYPQINLSGSPDGWFGAVCRTSGGGIDTIFIGGTPVSGVSLRSLFSLRSTDIVFSASENEIEITTFGFGHRVGMSQYGAKAMAENGSLFNDILTHYYTDITIKKLLCQPDRAVSVFDSYAAV